MSAMNFLQRCLRQPQGVWLRKALFQIHLWMGIGVGIYILLICVSGSAVVFNVELDRIFRREPVKVEPSGERLSDDALKQIVTQAYPENESIEIWPAPEPNDAVEVWIGEDDGVTQRLFDPYTGANLGHPLPPTIRLLMWLVDFHDNLLNGETGRKVNGIGSAFLVVLCLTGMVIWWPGVQSWGRSLVVDWRANWKRVNWTIHSALGFWTFLLVFMWAVTGVYLAFPEPFTAVVDYFEPPDQYPEQYLDDSRTGDSILRWLVRVHFGRNWGWPVKALWVVLGLAAPVLLVTGVVMWWNRVLRPARQALFKG